MSALICSNCGGITNSAVCKYRLIDNFVFKCYARVENGVWIKGCGYNDCDQWTRPSVDRLLGHSAVVNTDLKEFDFDRFGDEEDERD